MQKRKSYIYFSTDAVFIHVLNFDHILPKMRRALAEGAVLMYNGLKQ